jgi:NADPH:quinone reductase
MKTMNVLGEVEARIPERMRAVQRAADGTLVAVRRRVPVPGAGEVLVQLHAIAVNPPDLAARDIPGCSGAGIVVAVGPQVSVDRCGEDVWLLGDTSAWFTYAEFAVGPAEHAVPLPPGIGYEQAATLGVAAVTAHHALLADGDIAGSNVIVADAAGAVGSAAVQLAKWQGARVTGMVGLRPEEGIALEAGADEVVNCRCGRFLNRLARACGYGAVDRWVGAADDAKLASHIGPETVLALWEWQPGCRTAVRFVRGGQSRTSDVFGLPREVLARIAGDINAAIVAAALRPVVAQVFLLEEAAAAQAMLHQGGVPGSIVLKP